jgi:PAS domain S-box-containing protein
MNERLCSRLEQACHGVALAQRRLSDLFGDRRVQRISNENPPARRYSRRMRVAVDTNDASLGLFVTRVAGAIQAPASAELLLLLFDARGREAATMGDAIDDFRRQHGGGHRVVAVVDGGAGSFERSRAVLDAGADDVLTAPLTEDVLATRFALLARDGALWAGPASSNFRSATGAPMTERQLRALLDALQVGVVGHAPNGNVTLCNQAAVELLGLQGRKFLGQNARTGNWTALREDGSPFPLDELPAHVALRTGKPVRNVVIGVRRPSNGERAWLLVNVEPELDARGRVQQVIATFSDISERRRAEAELIATDRLAAMGRLAGGMAHEINNPLASLTINLDLLIEELASETVLRALGGAGSSLGELAGDCRASAERIRGIAKDLRTFARQDEHRGEAADLRDVVEAASNLAFHEIRHRARLTKKLMPAPPVTAADARLKQLVLNLLVSTAANIPEGHVDEHELVISTGVDARGYALLEVKDAGQSLAADNIERIFDPFYTSSAAGVGMGMRLAVCHAIVTSLGGEIHADDQTSEGTTFRVHLPPSDAAPAPPSSSSQPVALGQGRSVLVIDDDSQVCASIERMLRTRHRVTTETDARVALQRLRNGERFDFILCDVLMPVMTAIDFYSELETFAPEQAVRTVFMTGGVTTGRATDFVRKHAERLLQKPFDLATLEKTAKLVANVA